MNASSLSGAGGLSWRHVAAGWLLYCDGTAIGSWPSLAIPGLDSEDRVESLGEGVFRLTRRVYNAGTSPLTPLRLTLDFVRPAVAAWAMIPAVSYNGNGWGRGGEPKGFSSDGAWWTFSSRRTPVPGATYSEAEGWAVALWGEPSPALPVFSCSLMPADDATTHRLLWPEEETPRAYADRDAFGPGTHGSLSLAAGGTLTLGAVLVAGQALDGHRAIRGFLSAAWEMRGNLRTAPGGVRDAEQGGGASGAGTPRGATLTPARVWELSLRFARESLWAEEGSFRGFSIGLVPEGERWVQRPAWKYEVGWCGQNASLANSLLADHLRTGSRESLDKGMACLDAWAGGAPLPNGLFHVHYDHVLGIERREEVLDACNLGTGAIQFLEASALAARCGRERPVYRRLGLDLCGFMLRCQEESGRYGKGWSPDGRCLFRDGTIGAFVIPPMLEAYRITADGRYRDSARRAFAAYFGELERNGFSSAGALDTWCIDKESSLPLLRAALMLHALTAEDGFLEAAEHVSWYLSTWLWHCAAEVPADSDFSRHGFDAFGGTAVSVQHHHLDPYALAWVKDWLDLSERTGNPAWREKALAVWHNGNQLVSDGSLTVHGRTRPAGSQNEAFFHAAWKEQPGAVNDWLVAWPCAFRLETLRRLTDWRALE